MKKLNIYIFAYARKNLGDDLFIEVITKRYKNANFTIAVSPEYYESLESIPNLQRIDYNDNAYSGIDINNYDAFVYIGGSIFSGKKEHMTGKTEQYEFIKKLKEVGKPFFFVGCNYPVKFDVEFNEITEKIFRICEDVCFRDKYSKSIFKELDNVRSAPDVVLTFNPNKPKKNSGSLGISLIDLYKSYREPLRHNQEKYYDLIINTAKKFIANGKQVSLFSFCKCEGDEEAVKLVYNNFTEKERELVNIVNYQNDYTDFLAKYGQMEYMICTRFHSMILSLLFEQKIFVVSYNAKIKSVMNDLGENLSYVDLLGELDRSCIDESEFKAISNNTKDLVTKEAQGMFAMLDKFMRQ